MTQLTDLRPNTSTTSTAPVAGGRVRKGPRPALPAADRTASSTSWPHGTMAAVAAQVGADRLWQQGITGAGITVAVVDTGVSRVDALTGSVIAVADFSIEGGDPTTAGVDGHGHGTHLSGIIAGRTPGADPLSPVGDDFVGIAPGAQIASIKVAGRSGDVSARSVVAGIDWAIANADGLNIRVLLLALDTGYEGGYENDPIAAAVERAWDAGIVVVTAAGNHGDTAEGLGSPAHDPYVIAVGGVEATATGMVVPSWASSGDGVRNPDLAAPGAHIASLRAPGSDADLEHPEGFVDEQRFLGSGSSQSAAVVSGVAALLLEARPELTPDQVKRVLVTSAADLDAPVSFVGAGVVDVAAALELPATTATQTWTRAAADTHRTPLVGAVAAWMGSGWMGSGWMGSGWMGSGWMGSGWMGSGWMGSGWMGSGWMGSGWMGSGWMGSGWMGSGWMGSGWMGSGWMGSGWMGSGWMGSGWMGSGWMGSGWMGSGWMGSGWMGSGWMGSGWMGSGWMGSGWMGSGWMGSGWMGSGWMGSGWMGSGWMGSGWMGSGWMGSGWMGSGWM